MIDTAKRLIPAAIALTMTFGVTGAANARVVDAKILSPVSSAAAGVQHGPEVVKAGFSKKRFRHKHFRRHHHGKRYGYRGFGYRGYGQNHFRHHNGHGYVAKKPYFGNRGFFFKKRLGRRH